MSLKDISQKLEKTFLDWGWLAPAFFPVLEAIGRGPLNVCLGLYTAWGFVVLTKRGFCADRRIIILYGLLISVFGLSIIGAEDVSRAAKAWFKFGFVSLVYFMTLSALADDKSNWKRQFKCLAVAAVLTLIALFIRGGVVSDWQYLLQVRGLLERNLPFLLPFLLFSFKSFENRTTRLSCSLIACVVFTLVIVFSGGRAALVGLVVSLAVYSVVGIGLRVRSVAAITLLVLLVAGFLGGTKGVEMTRDLSTMDLDSISTGRTLFWRQALAHPPENQLLGVGLNNTRYYEDVVYIRNVKGKDDEKVKHLHNFVFDLWFEAGFAGLLVYLALMGCLIGPTLYRWRECPQEIRLRIAPILSATSAIFAAACLSFSFRSPQMSVYLLFLLAGLTSLSSSMIKEPEISSQEDINLAAVED